MTLRAHPNVIDMAEWKRARERRRVPAVRITFPGFASERLTPVESEALRREAKETSAYARKAFAHVRPIPEVGAAEAEKPTDEHAGRDR